MITQLHALLIASMLAVSPMLLTPAAHSVAPVTASASTTTPMPAGAAWAIVRYADSSQCPDPAACQANMRDVLAVTCFAWGAVNIVGGFLCLLTSIA